MSFTQNFDRESCPGISLSNLDDDLMGWFVARALSARGLALPDSSKPEALLKHLELWREGQPTKGALLLFGRKPQSQLKTALIKISCFAGTAPSSKRAKTTVKGSAFDLIDGALDFIQTRDESVTPLPFKIPADVLREALVNAVAHRDYTVDASIDVTLLKDRVEIWSPGALSPSLTIDALRRPHQSFPRNPRLAHCLYLSRYSERVGTGTRDMIMTTRGVGLPVPLYSIRDNGFLVTFTGQ